MRQRSRDGWRRSFHGAWCARGAVVAASLLLGGCDPVHMLTSCDDADERVLGPTERGELGVSADEIAEALSGLHGTVAWDDGEDRLSDVQLGLVEATVQGPVTESTRDAPSGDCEAGTLLYFEVQIAGALDGDSPFEGTARITARGPDLADIDIRHSGQVILGGELEQVLAHDRPESDRWGGLTLGGALDAPRVQLKADSNGVALRGIWTPE